MKMLKSEARKKKSKAIQSGAVMDPGGETTGGQGELSKPTSQKLGEGTGAAALKKSINTA